MGEEISSLLLSLGKGKHFYLENRRFLGILKKR